MIASARVIRAVVREAGILLIVAGALLVAATDPSSARALVVPRAVR